MINQEHCFSRSNHRGGERGPFSNTRLEKKQLRWEIVNTPFQKDSKVFISSFHCLEWTVAFNRFQVNYREAVCIPKSKTCERATSFLPGQTLGVFAYSACPCSCWRLLIRHDVLLQLRYLCGIPSVTLKHPDMKVENLYSL